ncbi:hypothetical protein [Streptomyces erythrochromogenes]|uniref:hypothetical protein n=1 Tax=Streptomyces erythrochromogenes TaxID=285574 RepID=UPI0036BEC1F6
MHVLAVLPVGDPLETDRRLQQGQDGLLATGRIHDLGVGERAAGAVGCGQDHRRLQVACVGQGVGELDDVGVRVVADADEEPRENLLAALVGFEEEFTEVGGDGRELWHGADAALRQQVGQSSTESGGEDLAVVGPPAGAQFQREGAVDFEDLVVGGVQEQDSSRL